MTNFDNKLNINNLRQTYTPSVKKDDVEVKQEHKADIEPSEANEKALQQSEMLGRTLVNKSLNPETVQSVKDAIEFYQKNQALAARAVKACDQACDLGFPYEEACCGTCDAAYEVAAGK